ncbi:GNAT family N-acetyltransferase [Aeribacillus sp. FSL K6-8394]|uniref:GNAT family N-acetyltransferase n=1 Tax=Aeribacillus sp. FSL K6-8394 TaxID=2954570 RepID=UPI0030F6250E
MKAVKAINEKQRNDAFYVRKKVFVEEQNVPIEIELDEYEEFAEHVVLYDDHQPVGAGRFRVIGNIGKLERICVLPQYRGKGAGNIILETLEKLAAEKGLKKIKLNAQVQVENFYKKHGYQTVSDIFMDAGIPHVTMEKTLHPHS